jgi:hypothetical protein
MSKTKTLSFNKQPYNYTNFTQHIIHNVLHLDNSDQVEKLYSLLEKHNFQHKTFDNNLAAKTYVEKNILNIFANRGELWDFLGKVVPEPLY